VRRWIIGWIGEGAADHLGAALLGAAFALALTALIAAWLGGGWL
jgi:hypothetical protein